MCYHPPFVCVYASSYAHNETVIDSVCVVCCVGKPQKSSRALCGNLSHSARHLRDRRGARRSLAASGARKTLPRKTRTTPTTRVSGAAAARQPRKTRTTRKTRGSGGEDQGVGLLGIILLLRVGLLVLLGRLGGNRLLAARLAARRPRRAE